MVGTTKAAISGFTMVVSMLAAGSASAQTPAASDTCVTYHGAYERAPLMKVAGIPGVRTHLQDKAKPCAATGACGWRQMAYLTPGDTVLVGAPKGGFRCIYFIGPSGRISAGFIADAALRPFAEPRGVDARFLAGVWREEDGGTITIAARGEALEAKGTTSNGDNMGAFAGRVKTTADGFTVSSDGCEIVARRRGPYLAVSDNSACGGMNVSFGGIYARRL